MYQKYCFCQKRKISETFFATRIFSGLFGHEIDKIIQKFVNPIERKSIIRKLFLVFMIKLSLMVLSALEQEIFENVL